MKRIFSVTALVLSILFQAVDSIAQNSLGKTDDVGRICLNSVIASNSSIPQGAGKMVINKLNQIAAKNGVGGSSLSPRFVITANVVELAQEVVPSAPPMVALELETTLYIGDSVSGTLYSTYSYGIRKCVGETADKAYLSALKKLPVDSPALRSFVEDGKNKIVEYYNSQIDFIISEAESLASQNRYDESISLLMQVPEVCKSAYTKAMAKATIVFQKKVDDEGAALLTKAKAAWKASATEDGAAEAAKYLGEISPAAACSGEANAFADSIAKHFKDLDDREWNFKMKQYNDALEQENRRMEHEFSQDNRRLDLEEKRLAANTELEGRRIDAGAERAKADDAKERYTLDTMKEIAASYGNALSEAKNVNLPWW